MWLAGQHNAIQQIVDGMDLYRVFASEAFNIAYDKIGKDSIERFIAKVCCLSLIYGTGSLKLRETIRIQSKGKTTVTANEAERLKDLYRDKNTNVVDAWKEGGQVLEWIKNDESHTVFGFLPVLGTAGIVKPNGLSLPYPKLTVDTGLKGDEWHYEVRRGRAIMRDKVYGAKVFQRTTQSLARDIMAEHTMNIAKRYHVAGLVHDEVICIVPDGEVEEAKAYITKTMRTPPAWAPDLPLDCEVGSGDRYGDAK
jgi:DNA polymerase I-like protein with 3'-5' exonuclease and polymerase domains